MDHKNNMIIPLCRSDVDRNLIKIRTWSNFVNDDTKMASYDRNSLMRHDWDAILWTKKNLISNFKLNSPGAILKQFWRRQNNDSLSEVWNFQINCKELQSRWCSIKVKLKIVSDSSYFLHHAAKGRTNIYVIIKSWSKEDTNAIKSKVLATHFP